MALIASWNVNSIKARAAHLLDFLDSSGVEVIALQELKSTGEAMPLLELQSRGWQVELVGQKSYNGVAILSRGPIVVRRMALPGDDGDTQARYLEVETMGLILGGIYLPNGNGAPEKFTYKLDWMGRLARHAEALLGEERPVVLLGDYNVIPWPEDCHDPKAWEGDALFRPETRDRFQRLLNLGFTDAFRACHQGPGHYTFWDYQQGAWPRDAGIRIDHILLSPEAADCLEDCRIDRAPRGREQPSDHTPILARLQVKATP